MPDILKARDGKDVEQAIAWAAAEGKPIELVGQGSKRGLGRPSQSDVTLDLSALTGVTLYEPEELVLSARAGTPIAEIEALVAGKGQELAFEPFDCSAILGTPAGRGTIGGMIAAGLSGPRRIKAGAARDHFLGVTAVSGRGETFQSGGRVVKNVTGYDLCKLLAGSFGTLAAMTDVTIKTLPRAETEQTLLLTGLDDEVAGRAMRAAMNSSCDISGAAHLPAAVAARTGGLPGGAVTALRIEGVAPSVVHRMQMLGALLQSHRRETLAAEPSRMLWRAIRDATPFAAAHGAETPLWRISTAPSHGPKLAAIAARGTGEYFYDWSGGLIWLCLPPSDDAGAAVRATVDVFQPQSPGLAALTARIKDSFDPKRVLNPGRMYAGV
jgi:glycolate oxidase FAD binding subunit